MLVISRKIGESFLIGDDIEATIIDITGEKVVVGISAPKSLAITRTGMEESAGGRSDQINARGYGRQYNSKLMSESK